MLMKLLGQTDSDFDDISQKRKFERRSSDQCVAEIDGKTYPVMNWSQGGALIIVDERLFAENDNLDVTMKFHIQDRIIPVTNSAHIIRKLNQRIAVEFDTMDDTTRQNFQKVIDDITTREFADSQA